MKHTKTIKKECTREESTRICDICKKRTIEEDNLWGISAKLEYSENRGLLSNYNTHIVDVCMHCMKNKVMPMIIEEFGVTPRTEN